MDLRILFLICFVISIAFAAEFNNPNYSLSRSYQSKPTSQITENNSKLLLYFEDELINQLKEGAFTFFRLLVIGTLSIFFIIFLNILKKIRDFLFPKTNVIAEVLSSIKKTKTFNELEGSFSSLRNKDIIEKLDISVSFLQNNCSEVDYCLDQYLIGYVDNHESEEIRFTSCSLKMDFYFPYIVNRYDENAEKTKITDFTSEPRVYSANDLARAIKYYLPDQDFMHIINFLNKTYKSDIYLSDRYEAYIKNTKTMNFNLGIKIPLNISFDLKKSTKITLTIKKIIEACKSIQQTKLMNQKMLRNYVTDTALFPIFVTKAKLFENKKGKIDFFFYLARPEKISDSPLGTRGSCGYLPILIINFDARDKVFDMLIALMNEINELKKSRYLKCKKSQKKRIDFLKN